MKKYSPKFWIIFWLTAAVFLLGWFFFWQTRFQGMQSVEKMVGFLPVSDSDKAEWKALANFADYFLTNDNQEKVFLVLFQNNMELRPGGGYIGSFGVVKIKNGKVADLQIHDLSNFDGRIPDTFQPPYPMKETLHINSWKLRDSNWSPDFKVNAEKAEEFYLLGQGQEKFDGVVGITTNVLTSFLKVTGPVEIEDYPGTYADENAILALEYQVEKGFYAQGVPVGERKSIMTGLAKAVIGKIETLGLSGRIELAKILLADLQRKDIQLYFHDTQLQNKAEAAGWSGVVDQNWQEDYLLLVDANLGAFKSDYYMQRAVDYSVDLTQEKPEAVLKITYTHTAKQKDWMTRDYLSFLRVYTPENTWFDAKISLDKPVFAKELGKKYLGALVWVPLDSTKTIELRYTLPAEIKNNPYRLKIQKQAGIKDVNYSVHILIAEGRKIDRDFVLNSDIVISPEN